MAASLWHGAEVVPVKDKVPLQLRSLDELKQMRDDKAALVQHLETELYMLQQPTELERRIAMLEGIVDVAERGDDVDPKERADFMRKFVEDLRDDHHHFLALHDQGVQAEQLPHGIVLKVAEHPILTEHRAQAEEEERLRKRESEQERHPDIGKPGLFAEQFKLVPNPYREQGWDYTQEVPGETPWHEWQETLDTLEEFDKRVSESHVGQVVTHISNRVAQAMPPFITEVFSPKEEDRPIQYGCGDVFVDKDRAKSTGRALRWQMAKAGLPVYGEAPAVTAEWLKENDIIKDEEEGDDEKDEEAAPPRALTYGGFEPSTLPVVRVP